MPAGCRVGWFYVRARREPGNAFRDALQCLAQDVGQCTAIRQTRSRPSRRCSPAARGSGNRRARASTRTRRKASGPPDALCAPRAKIAPPANFYKDRPRHLSGWLLRVSAPAPVGSPPDKAEFSQRLSTPNTPDPHVLDKISDNRKIGHLIWRQSFSPKSTHLLTRCSPCAHAHVSYQALASTCDGKVAT